MDRLRHLDLRLGEINIDLYAVIDWDILWPKLAELDTLKVVSVTVIVTTLKHISEKISYQEVPIFSSYDF